MAHNLISPLFRRWLAGVLAVLIGLGPLVTPAYAAGLTALGDEPLAVKSSAKPNIVLTVDDSTSMLFDFLPDYVVSTYCRGGTGAMTAACGTIGAASDFTAVTGGKYFSPGYTGQQYNLPYTKYTGTYDASGPGAGCFGGNPPTCSPGIDPGALPGIATFPAGPNSSWPNANQPYAYWSMWPAPAHSAGLNALYYDPRITYDPPVDSTGTSYAQMNAGGTANWSKVPGDPWASAVVNVDLTATVTDGLWCNSDWSMGSAADPTQCRYNGTGAAAFATVSAAEGQDYTYPWAPPGFVVSASAGLTTANTYAAQKVTLVTDPIYGALFGSATTAGWTNAQSQKYFYENENVLWCDPTNPSWPQTGPVVVQTCVNLKAQTCNAVVQTCNKAPGPCDNYVAPSCNGLTAGNCNGYLPPLCQGGIAGVCNNAVAPACNGIVAPSCLNRVGQTCNGTHQTCPTNHQTCSGPFAQTCVLPNTQTCQPPVCTTTFSPPGCNLLPPDPENPCNTVTNCLPPVCTPDPGHCSIQAGVSCTAANAAAVCVPQPGACSISGASCMAQNCPDVGHCSTDGALCTQVSDCKIIGGTCSKTHQACTKDTDCPNSGTCNVAPFATCIADAGCPIGPGTCNNKTCANGATVCAVNADCGVNGPCTAKSCTTNPGTCPWKNGLCSNGVTACQTAANCPITGGTCQTRLCAGGVNAGKVCTKNSDCPSSSCLAPAACTASAQCPATSGKCVAAGAKTGNACVVANPDCTTNGTCNNPPFAACSANPGACPAKLGTCRSNPAVTCTSASDCSSVGTCSNTHAACNSSVPCPNIAGVCSITNAACTTPGVDPLCPPIGTCSFTKGQCTSNNNCPNTPGPLSPSAASCTTGGVGGVAAATLRHDAENAGVVCRRNNKASGSYTSGPYTYPSGKFLTPITGSNPAEPGYPADACPSTNHYAATPRHYWKSEVQWCDKKIATAGDKWLGYGTDAGGTCQAGKDSTHIYPRFFQFGAASYVDNYGTSAFQRVDLDFSKRATASYTHSWIDANGQPQTITRNFDQEMTNYANWFAYYRTRIQAVKTVTSLTFTQLDDQYRVGFHTLSNGLTTATAESDPAKFVNIADFTPAQKSAWFQQLFAITIPLRLETPTLDAMSRIGDYFLNGTSASLSGSTDPIILSCQRNFHILFTDGFTNQQGLPTITVGNQDDTVPVLPQPVVGLTTGQPWPHPFREDPAGSASNAASDYAMKYWVTDLRPNGPNATNNVPTTARDPASWQHLNFAALSLGTQGKLPIANQSLTENLLAAGTLQWPQPIPTVWHPDNSGVDDLWHAAKNGRGRFVNAQTAAELRNGMGQILLDITNQAGSRAGVGLASSSISLNNHAVYRVTFQPGWAGTLTKINIDVNSGAELANLWEASTQLTAQLQIVTPDPTCVAPGSCPWFTNRRIFTTNDAGVGKKFLWNNLSAAQQDSLAPGQPAVGQAVLEFLRGNPTNEGIAVGQFRVRPQGASGSENFLGDIVDSQAVYVGPPNALYLESNDPGYLNFHDSMAARPARVYAGANDGMLHAFDDANGNETFGYIPHDLYRPDNTGLGALAYQDGAIPPFRHHFEVDSTPRIIDVDFGGPDWRTLLVGGLGKGGKSYYALDVTHPESIESAVDKEGAATAQYLWTFNHVDMGYSYGRPMIAKTRAFNGAWLVVVAAGYNNPSGVGRIYFIDAKTGALMKTMTTGFGSGANPSGLAYIAGYTRDFRNQLIDQIYGGDLYGNFWRFDVLDADPNKWTVELMAQLTDPAGNPQPVTTPPQIEVDLSNSVDRWVFVGTGRLLDDSDVADNQQQTFYAIRDGTTTTPNVIGAPLQPRVDLVPLLDKTNGLSTKPVNGWYDDFPLGERMVTPPQAAISVVAYATTKAQNNPCLTGLPAVLYVREFSLGETLVTDAAGNPFIDETQGAVGLDIAIFADASNPDSAAGVDIRIAVTSATTGDVTFQPTKPPSFLSAHRMSWRLLGQ